MSTKEEVEEEKVPPKNDLERLFEGLKLNDIQNVMQISNHSQNTN
jgi:hypothetical protein